MFTPLTWAVWIVLTSFVLLLFWMALKKSGIHTQFRFFLMYLFGNAFVLESEHVGSKHKTLNLHLTSHNN